jgi:hypothetical protein
MQAPTTQIPSQGDLGCFTYLYVSVLWQVNFISFADQRRAQLPAQPIPVKIAEVQFGPAARLRLDPKSLCRLPFSERGNPPHQAVRQDLPVFIHAITDDERTSWYPTSVDIHTALLSR